MNESISGLHQKATVFNLQVRLIFVSHFASTSSMVNVKERINGPCRNVVTINENSITSSS